MTMYIMSPGNKYSKLSGGSLQFAILGKPMNSVGTFSISQLRVILSPRKYLAISGDPFECHSLAGGEGWGWGWGAPGISWVEATDAVEYPGMHKTSPNSEQLPSPESQYC